MSNVDDFPDRESWKNSTLGRVVLKQYSQRGDLTDVVVSGGRVFHLTPQERRLNQEMAALPTLDPFANGTLVPVRLLDDGDAAEFASNPNIIGESEMKDLFKANWKKFDERISEMTNTAALSRLLELAKDSATGATVRQMEVIQERVTELSPDAANEHTTFGDSQAVTLRPVTPK